jgi:hypothetical protein
MKSNLSYEEYVAWCKSRLPGRHDSEGAPISLHDTTLPGAGDEDECPVTVRSLGYDTVVLTPRPRGSR